MNAAFRPPLGYRVIAIIAIGDFNLAGPTVKTVPLPIPSGKDQRFRIGRVHNHVNDTGFFVDKMDPVPAFSPIGCFESAPVATGPI